MRVALLPLLPLLALLLRARPAAALDAVLDLGSTNYLVGTLKKAGAGNPIEMVLNSQSKRSTPTLVGFDGELFHVGEQAAALQKTKPGLVFRDFVGHLDRPILEFAADPAAPELQPLANYTASLLLTALMHHIVEEQVRLSPAVSEAAKPGAEPEKVDVTLIVPAALPLPQVAAVRDVVESLQAARLLTTVPTPTAAVISYLSSRVQSIDQDRHPVQHYVVIDVGSHTTEVSVVESQVRAADDPKARNASEVPVRVTSTASLPVGGAHITEAVIRRYIVPRIADWEEYGAKNLKLQNSIFQAVEKAKAALAANKDIRIRVEDVTRAGDHLSMTLTRDQLRECVQEVFSEGLLSEAFGPIRGEIETIKETHRRRLAEAGAAGGEGEAAASQTPEATNSAFSASSAFGSPDASDFPEAPVYPLFLFYGGSSRVLAVQELLESFFRAQIQKYVNVEEAAIFGASLVAARHGSGFKLSNRFLPADYTRPELYYISRLPEGEGEGEGEGAKKGEGSSSPAPAARTPLFRLNPYIRKSIQNDLFSYEPGEFYLANDSFGVTYQNETKTTKEEDGENKTVTSLSYNTETLNVTYLRTRTDPFYSFEMGADGLFDAVCQFSLPPSKARDLADKAHRRAAVKWRHVKQVREEAAKMDAANAGLLALLEARAADPRLQNDYRLKMIVNVTTDGVSIPTVDFAGIQIQNWTSVNLERAGKEAGEGANGTQASKDSKAGEKAEITVLDIPFNVSCQTTFSPAFQTDPEVFSENVHFLRKCEAIKETRIAYEEKLNSIENLIYFARDVIESNPPPESEAGEEGDYLLYRSEEAALRKASAAAEQLLQAIAQEAPCGANIHCVNTRLERVEAVLADFEAAAGPVRRRIDESRCRPHSLERLQQGLEKLGATFKDAGRYLGRTLLPAKVKSEGEGENASESANAEEGANASASGEKDGSDQSTDPTLAPAPEELSPEALSLANTMDMCKALQEIDIDALMEQQKQSQNDLKAEKAESDRKKAETSWLKKLFSSETRKADKRLKLMEEELFYTKAMLKKIKKAASDCSYIESQHSKMKRAYATVADRMERTAALIANLSAEPSRRPETLCEEIDSATEENQEEAQRLQRFLKEVRTTIENGKIDKLMESLQKSSIKIRDGIQRMRDLGEILGHGTRAEIVQELARNFDIRAAAEKMDAAVVRFLDEQKALIDEISSVGTETYADLERRVREWFTDHIKDPEEQKEGAGAEGAGEGGDSGSGAASEPAGERAGEAKDGRAPGSKEEL